MKSNYTLQSVERTLRVLDCFSREEPSLRLTDISERLEINMPQTLRMVSTLESCGMLSRDPDSKRYSLGIKLFYLGMLVRNQLDLREVVQPYLRQLVDKTQETARLVVPDSVEPVCIDLVSSPRPIRIHAEIGQRMPWNAATPGKIMLAYFDEARREEILQRNIFRKFTRHTVTDPDVLRSQLDKIREQGYYVSIGELTSEDSCGIGAPIFDADDQIVGVITVVGPAQRLDQTGIDNVVRRVIHAARSATRDLGNPRVRNEFPLNA